MRKHSAILWSLAVTMLLALLVAPVFQSPTRAAPQYNITQTVTEPPTLTPTDTQTSETVTSTTVTVTSTSTDVTITSTVPTESQTPATVTPTEPQPTGVLVSTPTPTSPREDDDDDDDDREVNATPDVGLFKQADASVVQPGAHVNYTITAVNRGTASAVDVVVSDSLPEGMEIVEVTATRGEVSHDGRSVTVRIGDLEPGETVTVVVRARVVEVVAVPELRNSAVLESGSSGERVRQEASVSVSVELTPTPTVAETPVPRSAPLPQPADNRLPRTGEPLTDLSGLALLLVLGAAALFCFSLVARSYRR